MMGVLSYMGRDASENLPTGIPSVDEGLRGGLAPGRLAIIAGASGVGKSMLVQQLAESWARQGKAVGILSYEMDGVEMALRSLQANLGLAVEDLDVLRKHDHTPEEAELHRRIMEAHGDLMLLPVHYTTARLDLDGIERWVRSMHREHGIKAVVLDHLQEVPQRPQGRRH